MPRKLPLVPTRRPVPDSLFGGRLRGAYFLDLEVVQIKDLAQHVRSISFRSSDLVDFSYAPGQDLMIVFPAPGPPVRRRYTVRRSDPAAGTVEVEFELHTSPGPATAWAVDAEIGNRLEGIGPRGNIRLQENVASHVFIADDSAMPAAFAMLEALPPGTRATAYLVTSHGRGSRPQAGAGADAAQVWVDETSLAEAISCLDPELPVAAYVSGEWHLVSRATDLLVSAGIAKTAIAAKAYWRRDQPNAAHGEPSQD